jgi:hypothetical protein
MGSPPSAIPDPTDASLPHGTSSPAEAAPEVEAGHHDFEAQKRIHQQIRNDPDYDDWEYGTEPLPHEAWIAGRRGGAGGAGGGPTPAPQPTGEGPSTGG